MSNTTESALDKFIEDFVLLHQSSNEDTKIEYDPKWPSACYQGHAEQGELVHWKPQRMDSSVGFNNIEDALSLKIHPDLVTYYTRYWSNNIDASAQRGNLQLLFAWNQDDLIRLQQNLVGHVLMKRRLKQPETLFIGLTDEEDFIISMENTTGQITLERIGLEPQEVLAESMADFLQNLTPVLG